MWDAYGKEYLDFSAGIAVNALGGQARNPSWRDHSAMGFTAAALCWGREAGLRDPAGWHANADVMRHVISHSPRALH
jgi:hypothetical protein